MTDWSASAPIYKNSRETLHISLAEFNGHDLLSMRVFFAGADGEERPGKSGFMIRVEAIPEIIAALENARSHAERMGMLEGGEA